MGLMGFEKIEGCLQTLETCMVASQGKREFISLSRCRLHDSSSSHLCFALNFFRRTFYFSNVVAALEELHTENIAHRDIMPENIVIASDGYLKVCDFGTAKKLERHERAHTLCGAAEYCPPEMVQSSTHGREVDLWKLGLLFYEMFACCTPFDGENNKIIFELISSYAEISTKEGRARRLQKAKANMDEDEINLLLGLLEVNPMRRLGSGARGIQTVAEHPLLIGYFQSCKIKSESAPWVPDSHLYYGGTQNFEIVERKKAEWIQGPVYTGLQERFEIF